jgi:hypothetical protein
VTVATLKFVAVVASTGISLALSFDGQGIIKVKAAKTDSVVIVESKTIALGQLVDVIPALFTGKTGPVVVAEFTTANLHNLNVLSDSVEAPTLQVALTPLLPATDTTSASPDTHSFTPPIGKSTIQHLALCTGQPSLVRY